MRRKSENKEPLNFNDYKYRFVMSRAVIDNPLKII